MTAGHGLDLVLRGSNSNSNPFVFSQKVNQTVTFAPCASLF